MNLKMSLKTRMMSSRTKYKDRSCKLVIMNGEEETAASEEEEAVCFLYEKRTGIRGYC